MTDSYHKARKSYGLFSALLIAWELIGIELTKETPIENFNLIIKAPKAIPFILVTLVIYFAFRFTIEWLLIEVEGRKILPARIDYYVAHSIGITAIMIIIIQTFTKIQLFNLIVGNSLMISLFIATFLLTFSLIKLFYLVRYKVSWGINSLMVILMNFIFIISVGILFSISNEKFMINLYTSFLGVIIAFSALGIRAEIKKLFKKYNYNSPDYDSSDYNSFS